MTPNILVTGASGNLGSHVLDALTRRGIACAGTGRHPAPAGYLHEWHIVNLQTGDGLADAVSGRTGIIHCATSQASPAQDRVALDRLIELARSQPLHITFISVAGIEDAARHLPYYRVKLECETALQASGVAHSIVRATQFHEFADTILKTLGIGPVLLKPMITLQPLDVSFAARMIVDTAIEPRMELLTLRGPETLTFDELARPWQRSRKSWMFHLPVPSLGPLQALAALHIVSGTTGGRRWAQWVEDRSKPSQ